LLQTLFLLIQVPPTVPTPASPNTDPSQLCSPVTGLKFGSFDAAHFSFDAAHFSCDASHFSSAHFSSAHFSSAHFSSAHFSSAHFSSVAPAIHPPVPATDSNQQFQEWRSVCRNNQERHPDPYALFPMDVYNRDSFWPYPG